MEAAFGTELDYAQLVKVYGSPREGEQHYSPGECIGYEGTRDGARPDPQHVSTSYAGRQNLTRRMSSRRFTRLTNAFSKKVKNHVAALAIYAAH